MQANQAERGRGDVDFHTRVVAKTIRKQSRVREGASLEAGKRGEGQEEDRKQISEHREQ